MVGGPPKQLTARDAQRLRDGIVDVDAAAKFVEEVARNTAGSPALRHPVVAALIAETANRKREIEVMVRRRIESHNDPEDGPLERDVTYVTEAKPADWVEQRAAFVENPARGLRPIEDSDDPEGSWWPLPTVWDMGHEAWVSAAVSTLQGIRQRLSDDYWKHRSREAGRSARGADD